ncbi:MAG: hypothetical protein ACN6QY_28210 [Pseudomonas sp.]|uniref:hypothetical protein n=1 Tax=unclassified Pseudomonas TaxID=196821 RepID=UPI000731DE0B|nr:hypothetical protein [Pseudomonas sp. L5B5]KTC33689.1 hypothetical protein AO265_04980 [Pseudomonas sp. ABAC61]UCZ83754.1 hypothetical protein LGQ10_25940 [Pseudomonas sp. L5B5]
MRLNDLENDFRRDLQGTASDLRWSAVELRRIAQLLRQSGNGADADALQRMCELFQGHEEGLTAYADEIKAHLINRRQVQ